MSAEVEDRPGPLGWGVIAVGWVVIAVALVAGFTDDRLGGPGSWVIWLLGAAVVHDAILLPAVVLVGVVLARVVPPTWRPAVRAALVVGGIVALTVWPIARRWGARADNPSILPVARRPQPGDPARCAGDRGTRGRLAQRPSFPRRCRWDRTRDSVTVTAR